MSTVKDPLLLQSATELAKKIRSRQVSAEEVMQAFINRVEEVNAIVNAVVCKRYDNALVEAREVDRILSLDPVPKEFSETSKPFLGVPLTVKECFALKGMPQTSGLVSRREIRADHDAPTVDRLKQSGMIPLATTNTSELCMWYESANNLYGRTKNAYDNNRIVGGSSGGEGCIVSSGASLLGIGSDIGGSIRMPAFFNGVFGHRPSRDIVPNEGQYPTASGGQIDLLATGPICRYAADLVPVLKIMAGPSVASLKLDIQVDLSKVNVFSMEDDGGSLLTSRVDPQLKEAQSKAFKYLQSKAASAKAVELNLMKYSLEMWLAKMVAGNGTKFAVLMAGGEETGQSVNCFLELAKRLFGLSNHTLPAIGLGIMEALTRESDPSILKLLSMLQTLREQLCTLLGEDGVLLYPSHPCPAPYHNQPLCMPLNFAYTGIFNALGLPVTQVPLGLGKEGLPLGMQVVAAPYQDHLTLAVAAELEKGFGGWVSPGGEN